MGFKRVHLVMESVCTFMMSVRLSAGVSVAPTGRIDVKFNVVDLREKRSRNPKCSLDRGGEKYEGVLISPWPDQEGNKLQRPDSVFIQHTPYEAQYTS